MRSAFCASGYHICLATTTALDMSTIAQEHPSMRSTLVAKRPRFSGAAEPQSGIEEADLIPLGKNSVQGEKYLQSIGHHPRRVSRHAKKPRVLKPLTGIPASDDYVVSGAKMSSNAILERSGQSSLTFHGDELDARLCATLDDVQYQQQPGRAISQEHTQLEDSGQEYSTSSSSMVSPLCSLTSQNSRGASKTEVSCTNTAMSLPTDGTCLTARQKHVSSTGGIKMQFVRGSVAQPTRRSMRQSKPSRKVREMTGASDAGGQKNEYNGKELSKSLPNKELKSDSRLGCSGREPGTTSRLRDNPTASIAATKDDSLGSVIILDVKPILKRKKPMRTESELAVEEFFRSRMTGEELSHVRVAFCVYYPPPPSNMEAQGRYELMHGRAMSAGLEKSLWERELKPWSERWWELYQMFNDEVRQRKMKKSLHKSTAVSISECRKWAKAFHRIHGDARKCRGSTAAEIDDACEGDAFLDKARSEFVSNGTSCKGAKSTRHANRHKADG